MFYPKVYIAKCLIIADVFVEWQPKAIIFLSKMNKFKVFEKDTQANLFKTKNQINEIALKTYVIKQISKHSFHKKYLFNCYTKNNI